MTASVSLRPSQQINVLLICGQTARAVQLAESAMSAGWRTIVCANIQQAYVFVDQQGGMDICAVVLDDTGADQTVQSIVGRLRRRRPNLSIIVADTARHNEWTLEIERSDTIRYLTSELDGPSIAEVLEELKRGEDVGAEFQNSELLNGDQNLRFSPLLGNDPVFRSAVSSAVVSARSDENMIVEGELGTGKRTLAQAVHYASPRRTAPVETLQLRGTSEGALEASVVGYERGAFVGAFKAQAGLLQQCHRGTLIIEEADLLPLVVQEHLAKAVVERRVKPLGSSVDIPVDVRIVALSERSLGELVCKGLYSSKLFACLNAIRIQIPPLRERGGDVCLVASHFLRLLGPALGRPALAIDKTALASLAQCEWRGNVRKLQAVLCQAAAFARSDIIKFDDLAKAMCKRRVADTATNEEFSVLDEGVPLRDHDGNLRPLADIEDDVIQMAMQIYGGSMTQVAVRLGIGRSTLYRKLAELASRPGS